VRAGLGRFEIRAGGRDDLAHGASGVVVGSKGGEVAGADARRVARLEAANDRGALVRGVLGGGVLAVLMKDDGADLQREVDQPGNRLQARDLFGGLSGG
jgi:hypothetical protein